MKRVVIVLVFILPVWVFLFLRFFGKNEFDIPVFYKESAPENSDCRMTYNAPYKVPDSIMQKLNAYKSVSFLVVDSIVSDRDLVNVAENFPKVSIYNLKTRTKAQGDFLKKCFLFLKTPNNAVLIDSSRQIRGYYRLPERDEMDRLDVELNILLKKY